MVQNEEVVTGENIVAAALWHVDVVLQILNSKCTFACWTLCDAAGLCCDSFRLLCLQAESPSLPFHHRLHRSADPVLLVPYLDGSCCQGGLLRRRRAEGEAYRLHLRATAVFHVTVILIYWLLCKAHIIDPHPALLWRFSLKCHGSLINTTRGSTGWWNWSSPRLCHQICSESSSWTRTSPLPPTSLSSGPSSTSSKVMQHLFLHAVTVHLWGMWHRWGPKGRTGAGRSNKHTTFRRRQKRSLGVPRLEGLGLGFLLELLPRRPSPRYAEENGWMATATHYIHVRSLCWCYNATSLPAASSFSFLQQPGWETRFSPVTLARRNDTNTNQVCSAKQHNQLLQPPENTPQAAALAANRKPADVHKVSSCIARLTETTWNSKHTPFC